MTLDELFQRKAVNALRAPIFDQEPEHIPVDESRVRGMMLGLAIGDALGNTSEGMNPSARMARHGEIRDCLPNRYIDGQRAGLPSVDTQLAFGPLEHLIACGELVPGRLAQLFASRRIFGIGRSVSGLLRNYRQGLAW